MPTSEPSRWSVADCAVVLAGCERAALFCSSTRLETTKNEQRRKKHGRATHFDARAVVVRCAGVGLSEGRNESVFSSPTHNALHPDDLARQRYAVGDSGALYNSRCCYTGVHVHSVGALHANCAVSGRCRTSLCNCARAHFTVLRFIFVYVLFCV